VVPTWRVASSAFVTSGRATEICVWPERWISGSATPSWSTRSRMMSMERSTASFVTSDCLVGLAS
jgi:hypothetical protein